jgi:hypothetical protein
MADISVIIPAYKRAGASDPPRALAGQAAHRDRLRDRAGAKNDGRAWSDGNDFDGDDRPVEVA